MFARFSSNAGSAVGRSVDTVISSPDGVTTETEAPVPYSFGDRSWGSAIVVESDSMADVARVTLIVSCPAVLFTV